MTDGCMTYVYHCQHFGNVYECTYVIFVTVMIYKWFLCLYLKNLYLWQKCIDSARKRVHTEESSYVLVDDFEC